MTILAPTLAACAAFFAGAGAQGIHEIDDLRFRCLFPPGLHRASRGFRCYEGVERLLIAVFDLRRIEAALHPVHDMKRQLLHFLLSAGRQLLRASSIMDFQSPGLRSTAWLLAVPKV